MHVQSLVNAWGKIRTLKQNVKRYRFNYFNVNSFYMYYVGVFYKTLLMSMEEEAAHVAHALATPRGKDAI